MFVSVVVNGDEPIDEYLIEADCDYQPAEDPEYDGGGMIYPGCESSVDICDYTVFDNATLETIEHVLTDYEEEAVRMECFRMVEENDDRDGGEL